MIEKLKFLNEKEVHEIARKYGTPVYVYDQQTLIQNAKRAMSFPNSYGLTSRYAMKASSNAAILKIFDKQGLHIDASSGYEAERAIKAGIKPQKILLTAQQMPEKEQLKQLVKQGIHFNACSLHQLETYGKIFPGKEVSIRFNPGLGSGFTTKTNVGGPSSSFGIWHKHQKKAQSIVHKYKLRVKRIHTHIGSGSDPEVWKKVAGMSIKLLHKFPEASILNLGGGYKIARMSYEKATDFQKIGKPVKELFQQFHKQTGRKIRLEIEPGTAMVANAGALIATIIDITTTGKYNFIKANTGMTELLRPSLYGAQHPIIVVPKRNETKEYVVVGHCCESGDLITPKPGMPEAIGPRKLTKAEIEDILVIEGTGAYCSSMSTINYNSFPQAPEVLITKKGPQLIRKRQTTEQITQNEIKCQE